MKNNIVFVAALAMVFLSSCEVVGGIFKAGMGFGIFLVVVVVGLIIFLISKMFGGGTKS